MPFAPLLVLLLIQEIQWSVLMMVSSQQRLCSYSSIARVREDLNLSLQFENLPSMHSCNVLSFGCKLLFMWKLALLTGMNVHSRSCLDSFEGYIFVEFHPRKFLQFSAGCFNLLFQHMTKIPMIWAVISSELVPALGRIFHQHDHLLFINRFLIVGLKQNAKVQCQGWMPCIQHLLTF